MGKIMTRLADKIRANAATLPTAQTSKPKAWNGVRAALQNAQMTKKQVGANIKE
jgi:hypothetical protein